MKNIVLVNDMPGYGKVALGAMQPILSKMGHGVFSLPTALVSNTLNYGEFEILDTTSYMKNTIEVWDKLKFKFDCITTGFVINEDQVNIISEFIKKHKNIKVIVDPIMGDNGKLYNGVSNNAIKNMLNLIKLSDVILPNFTEAKYMANIFLEKNKISENCMWQVIDKLRNLGAKSIIVTSVYEDTGKHYVYGYSNKDNKKFKIEYSHMAVNYGGTGDIFSAIITGHISNEKSLEDSVSNAIAAISNLIELSLKNKDENKFILIEKYLKDIERYI